MVKVFSVNKLKRYLIIKKVYILSLLAQIDVSCHKTLIHFYSIEIIPNNKINKIIIVNTVNA